MDLALGDPTLPWPHPVVFIGRLLNALERPARRFMLARRKQARLRGKLAGFATLIVLVTATSLVVRLLLLVPYAEPLVAVYLAWAGLAMGSLLKTGGIVLKRVEEYPEKEARSALSWLVSRDTSAMDRPLMRKTLADTMSENFTDALTAPFFWLLVGGPVALWVYKAVSTTDSMWGYRTRRWRWLGFAGARSDDCLAFIPARISIAALWFTDFLARHAFPSCRSWQGRWPGFMIVSRQAWGMPSPNSGCPMAACAWLCGARMAGPSVYFGELVHKPWLGPDDNEAAPWDKARLLTLFALMRLGTLCGMNSLWLFLLCITALCR
ncbi:MAG: cobalamin biosynthesis protein [Desulfovibrio sp.]|nr:cobalamin biosynthesis protein [Desulfovibrio sp.]